MKLALDTNLLIYAEAFENSEKRTISLDILDRQTPGSVAASVQVLGETFRVLTGKGRLPVSEAHAIVMKWRNLLAIVATTNELMLSALELAADHKIYIWDALILAAAAEARCDLLLSEDFQDGFAWRGVTVVNPFAEKPHKMLAKLLRG